MTDSLFPPSFVPELVPPAAETAGDYWFVFRGRDLLIQKTEGGAQIPRKADLDDGGPPLADAHYLGRYQGVACYTAEGLENGPLSDLLEFRRLRSLLGLLDEELFWLAGRAVQIVDWDRTHRFCGVCGKPMVVGTDERVKICSDPECGHRNYPQLAPAVIVAIRRGNELLLARSHRHPPGLYSVLAGFVEPGETLEECVRREVHEEVGLDVKNIRYFGSQPWPFPHSLMIAFTCEYAGGEIVLEEAEMAAADWFTAGNLPQIPPPVTISRRLIDWFVNGQQPVPESDRGG